MIGVISAMSIEANSLIAKLENGREVKILDLSFWVGKIHGKEVVITVSGVGKVSAGLATALMIEHFQPQLIINSGVAGGFDQGTNHLDVIVGDKIAYYDFDISFDGAYQFGQIPDAPLWFNSDEKAARLAMQVNLSYQIHYGRIITADCFQTSRQAIEEVLGKLGVATVHAIDMESAAVAQIAYKLKTPFLIIRSISDILGHESQAESYYEWIGKACENAIAICQHVIVNY